MTSTTRVVCLVYDGLCTFEFGIVTELFALPRPEFDFPWYDFALAGVDPVIRGMGGYRMQVDGGLDLLDTADLICLPGWRDRNEAPPAELSAALARAHARGARLMSICSGAFLLGAAGLLDGRPAATHWRYAADLQARFPDAQVRDDVLYTEADGIVTSAGSSAGIDAGLHLIRTDHGAKVANLVARRLVMPPHRDGGQAQFVDAPVRLRPGSSLAPVLDWARGQLAGPMGVPDMAKQAGQSERTFLRRFREATGQTPVQWLRRERVLRAMRLLEETALTLEDIAEDCGFGSQATFRATFHEFAGTSPSAYRERFRIKRAAL
ncbi:transcriptional regulator FtrA [Chachezhania sediminis]|uniref:transcriptional regulator FtrA n=1 Tax=Chachezhania sediminis TaxID=2599291 RepID=UPI00131CEC1C|nr:transcriptional regulator FtrA [Chachezhania sediminis]